jgi:GTP1/Obg family GTP-binding protein
MNTQVNWQKIRSEFNRLADVDTLKSEVQRIGTEIRKFDFHTVLSPAAQQKVKAFEKRYTTLMRTISQAQRQMDREFNRIMREIKTRRKDVNKAVTQQKTKLEAVSKQFKKNFSKKSAAATKKRAGAAKTGGTKKRK